MATTVTGLADSHFIWKISTDNGVTFTKVDHLTSLDIPEREKTMDEVTTTDAHNVMKAAVDFSEDKDIEFELVLDPTDPQHIALEKAYEDGTVIKNQIHFINTAVKGFEFDSQISKFAYDSSDVKKKMRVKGTHVISSDIIRITSAPTTP